MAQKVPSRELTTDWAVDNGPGGGSEPKGDQGFAGLTVLTQLQGTYLVALMKSGLILIDQHAAHERILYERYLKQWQSGGIASQYLIVPILIEGSPGWTIELETIQSALGALGFEVTSAGGNSWWIKSIPVGIGPGQAEKALGEILEEIRAGGGLLESGGLCKTLAKTPGLSQCDPGRADFKCRGDHIFVGSIGSNRVAFPLSSWPSPLDCYYPGKKLKNDSRRR